MLVMLHLLICGISLRRQSITKESVSKYIDFLASQYGDLSRKSGQLADELLIISGEALVSSEMVLR